MVDINSFYNSILNIDTRDKTKDIKNIVLGEKRKLTDQVEELDGFCKYIANQIKYQISVKLSGVHVYYLNLEELVGVDHVALIAEYMNNDNLVRLLIDPTFSQFVRKDNNKLVYLDFWPSDKINDKDLVQDLIDSGVSIIDNDRFQQYINSFSNFCTEYNLDNFLNSFKIQSRK